MLPKKRIVLLVWLLAVLPVLWLAGCAQESPEVRPTPPVDTPEEEEAAMDFKLTSSAFENGARIPEKYTADGADISPPLSWEGAPEGTQEFALICNDPDAPVGDWVHWVLYGVPADFNSLYEGISDRGILQDLGGAKQGENDFGTIGYGGPAPPKGPAHHYHFTLYALDAKTDIPPGKSDGDVKTAIADYIIAETELVGTYSR